MYTHARACTGVRAHTHTHAHIQSHTHTHTHNVYTCMHMHACMRTCTHTHTLGHTPHWDTPHTIKHTALTETERQRWMREDGCSAGIGMHLLQTKVTKLGNFICHPQTNMSGALFHSIHHYHTTSCYQYCPFFHQQQRCLGSHGTNGVMTRRRNGTPCFPKSSIRLQYKIHRVVQWSATFWTAPQTAVSVNQETVK